MIKQTGQKSLTFFLLAKYCSFTFFIVVNWVFSDYTLFFHWIWSSKYFLRISNKRLQQSGRIWNPRQNATWIISFSECQIGFIIRLWSGWTNFYLQVKAFFLFTHNSVIFIKDIFLRCSVNKCTRKKLSMISWNIPSWIVAFPLLQMHILMFGFF